MNAKSVNRKALAAYVSKALASYPFDATRGWDQVQRGDDEQQRQYGEFSVLLDLAEHFDLDLAEKA